MRARKDVPFAEFCKAIGDGTWLAAVPCDPVDPLSTATVDLPNRISAPYDSTSTDLLSWVYEGFESLQPAQWPQFYESRCVLAPTNVAADELNTQMWCTFPR